MAQFVEIREESVHPHACGEHISGRFNSRRYAGSSPRVRGTRRNIFLYIVLSRFIPTRAGNTPLCSAWAYMPYGSSPRVRGTLLQPCGWNLHSRFIPTRAGNTPSVSTTITNGTVHPHACGEHDMSKHMLKNVFGSSPRVRGTPCNVSLLIPGIRFIPTRAGNTDFWSILDFSDSVHPHACGEHLLHLRGGIRCGGSSPRVRGTLPPKRRKELQVRFIPTRAGNTFLTTFAPARNAVHPHACGEHLSRRK